MGQGNAKATGRKLEQLNKPQGTRAGADERQGHRLVITNALAVVGSSISQDKRKMPA